MIFLKLGGSLITDKAKPETAREEVISGLSAEIAALYERSPDKRLLIGHGSGSFGHHEAAKHGTPNGVWSASDWLGYARVWQAARRLNQLIIQSLTEHDLPIVCFPPSASAVCRHGRLVSMSTGPLTSALTSGIIPVIHGDVAFDEALGGTIVSTEEVFLFLSRLLQPERILLAGREPGVFSDPQNPESLLEKVHERDLPDLRFDAANGTDVTGGMHAKVKQALAMAKVCPQSEVLIFSPEKEGDLLKALQGASPGTRILP